MNNIKEITQFKCIDGSVFDTLNDAEKYNELLNQCDEIENVLISRPRDSDFANGIGWIQHPVDTKRELAENILNIYNKYFDVEHKSVDNTLQRHVEDASVRCLKHLLYRWQCISIGNREYGQPYYANKPLMSSGGQIN